MFSTYSTHFSHNVHDCLSLVAIKMQTLIDWSVVMTQNVLTPEGTKLSEYLQFRSCKRRKCAPSGHAWLGLSFHADSRHGYGFVRQAENWWTIHVGQESSKGGKSRVKVAKVRVTEDQERRVWKRKRWRLEGMGKGINAGLARVSLKKAHNDAWNA